MSNFRVPLLYTLLLMMPALALAQATPGALPTGPPISDIDRLMREKDTNERFFNKAMATLNLTYTSSGDLKSSLIKTELHSLFMTVEINGKKVKSIAKTEKPKIQEAIEPGPMNVKGRWARPGTRRQTKCVGELAVGFYQVVFLPFGGIDDFSCHIELRNLPEEVYTEWKGAFDEKQNEAYGSCASEHPRGTTEFWGCIDEAGISFPAA